MSEEILKALMQLFAIIAKQDNVASIKERNYVSLFLSQQLNKEIAAEYLELFDNFSKPSDEVLPEKKLKLTSVKDSVKTLSICKKINKTLTGKQKIIVLIRLLELLNTDEDLSNLGMQIIDTVATVFNISPEDYQIIEKFVLAKEKDILQLDFQEMLIVGDLNAKTTFENAKSLDIPSQKGFLVFLYLRSAEMYFLKYVGHSDVLLNGLPLQNQQVYLFISGSTVKTTIGEPLFYSDVLAKFVSDKKYPAISFEANQIDFFFPNQKQALHKIQINEGPGKLVGIMGGSGAGKTTLLNVLSGIENPSRGEVLINHINLHKEKEKLQGVIGFVAQDDILFEELTVFENLYFNAKLCLNHLSKQELESQVDITLKNLGLIDIKNIKVGNVLNKKISGGQRKRLNIAFELIREPSILFLDEPTSGLSSRDSENVMDLLKELSLKGKLIFLVIHQPSSDIFKMFDKIYILDNGGFPVYYGNPVQAVIHFKTVSNQINSEIGQCLSCGNVNPEQIFNIIDAKVVDEYGNLTDKRKKQAKDWNQVYIDSFKSETVDKVSKLPPKSLFLPTKLEQTKIFVIREWLNKISNHQYILINLLEAPVLAFVLAFVIYHVDDKKTGIYSFSTNENIPAYLFMCVIVSIFMGLTVSAEEIIKDAKILKRERFLNLSRNSYLFSKIIILFFISAIQAILFVLVGNSILEIKGMYFSYWLMLFSLSCTANLIGLNISSAFNSAVTIYIIIPLLLIPQMILSGGIFSFDKLNKTVGSVDQVPFIADLMPSRWGYEGLAVHQFKDNKFEKYFFAYEMQESQADFIQVYWNPYLSDKVKECRNLIDSKDQESQNIVAYNLNLIKTEILKQHKINSSWNLKILNSSTFDKNTEENLNLINVQLDEIKEHFLAKFQAANIAKDAMITNMLSKPETEKIFKNTKLNYYNESLSDMVKRIDAKKRVEEYNGCLVQIIDPVFQNPQIKSSIFSYRAHFYSPYKTVFNHKFDTFYFNVIVLWIIVLILYIFLYFDILKKIINLVSSMSQNK